MKVASGKWLRARAPLCGALALGALGLTGCGDKESSPDAVSVSELKYPGDLAIWDKGDGKVVLEWSGANNEEDFDGYNVYGMKGTATALGVTEGVALELLDDKGDKNTTTEAILAKFNYDPATTKLEAPGTAIALAETAEADSDAPEFSYLPIHTGPADARLLPTCKAAGGTCTMTTAATKDLTAENPTYAVNGRVKFEVPETLKVGESYCFFVMSSMDGGETVSQTSSNVQCVTPKYSVGFNLPIPAGADDPRHLDLRAYLTACDAAGKCAAPGAPVLDAAAESEFNPSAKNSHTASDPMPIYIETSTTGAVGFVAGKAAAVNDLGYYEKGFDDVTLPKGAPVLVLDDSTIGGTGVNKDAPVFNAGGYSIPGQTVPLVAGHVYVFGVGAATASGIGPFHYHWLYVKSAPAGGNAAVEMRLTKKAI